MSSDDDIYDEGADIPPDTEVVDDIEAFAYECLTAEQAKEMLLREATQLRESLNLSDLGEARMLLHCFNWHTEDIIKHFRESPSQTLEQVGVRPLAAGATAKDGGRDAQECQTCFESLREVESRSLACGHTSCVSCWIAYLQVEITEGRPMNIACMARDCVLILPEAFVLQLIALDNDKMKERYLQSCFNEWVRRHPKLRFCAGKDCAAIIKADKNEAKRVICAMCTSQFCFVCGENYHAPTDCRTMRKWMVRQAEDSETASYIYNYTKDCPGCGVSINKDGGCNWITCKKCNCRFCWICMDCNLEYTHQCSLYGDPGKGNNVEAIPKYLFYYARWDSHEKSLRLEEETKRRINEQINQRVMAKEGTWIDWKYLFDAMDVLAKSRYTLQYTYPLAFYLEPGPRKDLFEYQQAELETAVEALSFQLEQADTMDKADISNQMNAVEKRRIGLLKAFLNW